MEKDKNKINKYEILRYAMEIVIGLPDEDDGWYGARGWRSWGVR